MNNNTDLFHLLSSASWLRDWCIAQRNLSSLKTTQRLIFKLNIFNDLVIGATASSFKFCLVPEMVQYLK